MTGVTPPAAGQPAVQPQPGVELAGRVRGLDHLGERHSVPQLQQPAPEAGPGQVDKGHAQVADGRVRLTQGVPALPWPGERLLHQVLGELAVRAEQQGQPEPLQAVRAEVPARLRQRQAP